MKLIKIEKKNLDGILIYDEIEEEKLSLYLSCGWSLAKEKPVENKKSFVESKKNK